ncbi:MAG: 3'(2') 5'-bisphosphate nucleotidase [Hyphomonadaceae bacterium]|nr:MAG: 3'(2') 5'-bisphosphate nucleotidase [Hyphomonadaceae bacterium]KAF0183541.1 MAG: 3'(2') 5'-bisphosphate nucleotidase [Hyphomonadaceae bacterium]
MLLSDLKPNLIKIALAAGFLIQEIAKQGFATTHKADSSTLTDADLATNELIIGRLQSIYPDILVVSEEGNQYRGEGLETGDWFIIDPLDGTRGFAKGSKEYTVNIALIRNGIAIAGVIFAPDSGELYYGDNETGAVFFEVKSKKLEPEVPIAAQKLREPALLLVSRHHLDAKTKDFTHKFENPKITQMNSSIKLCKIAAGEGDIYPRFGPTSQWDIAAGQAILEAAGGRVLQMDGTSLKYGRVDENGLLRLNPNFVACGNFIPAFLPFVD